LTVTDYTVEISRMGKWITVPALKVGENALFTSGRWIKKAVVHDEDWLEGELEDPELCVKRLKERGLHRLRADIFTFSQKPPKTVPQYRYPMKWDSVAVIRLTCFKDWWEGLPQETRKNVRRSQKRGVVVRVEELDDDLVRKIIDVNNDSPVRQGKHFAHYGKTFDQVKKDQSTYLGRSAFICAYAGDELIGFLKMVYRGETASILQILPRASHQDKRPANALIAKAVELCEARGVSCLVYGMFNYGNKRDSPLLEFKIRNGFEEILMPRFYIPLTVKGSVCMKLNLHRGFLAVLPPSVITLGVRARAKWSNLKQFISRCSSMVERPNRNRQTECSNPPAGSKL
jgi:GNAT acetyltransferase-like protein